MHLLLVELAARPHERDTLVARLHELFAGAPPGLVQYTIGSSNDDAGAIVLVEEWDDAAAQATFLASAAFAQFRADAGALFVAPPASREFQIELPHKPTISLI